MRIGISLFSTANANIWSNGLNQNIAFLVMLLRKIPGVEKVFLLNGGDASEVSKDLRFDGLSVEVVKPEEVTYSIDVVIEMGASMPIPWLRHLKALGGVKLVSFLVGHPYAGPVETMIFDRKGGAPFHGSPWDEVWLLPQYVHSGAALLRTITRAPVFPMPHIWDPYFLDLQLLEDVACRDKFGFTKKQDIQKPWRVAILEPNISVAKNCFIPMLVCEEAYRRDRQSIETMMVLNTFHMKDHMTFNRLAANLDLTRDSKASYETRLRFLDCMVGQDMDAVVSHHWENGQNYLSYEVLYGGYPLIHNSTFLKAHDMGFYYPDFSATSGAEQLLNARTKGSDFWAQYHRNSRDFLRTVSPHDRNNIEAFATRVMTAEVNG